MANLHVSVCGLEFSNPILPAAGPPSKDGAMLQAAAKGGAGGLVTKTISVNPAEVPRPCMAEIRGGFMNTELWSELPKEQWLETEYKLARATGLPVIVGLGYTADQIRELAPLVKPYADALELSTHYVGNDISPIVNALKAAKEAVDVPVFMKLSPHPNIQEIAIALEQAGADGLVMINSFGPCLSIDLETGLPLMGSKDGFGWLSGAAIKPLALRCVYQAARVVQDSDLRRGRRDERPRCGGDVHGGRVGGAGVHGGDSARAHGVREDCEGAECVSGLARLLVCGGDQGTDDSEDGGERRAEGGSARHASIWSGVLFAGSAR